MPSKRLWRPVGWRPFDKNAPFVGSIEAATEVKKYSEQCFTRG